MEGTGRQLFQSASGYTAPMLERAVGVGSVLIYTSNDLHGMRNISDKPATYYVIRALTDTTPKESAAANYRNDSARWIPR